MTALFRGKILCLAICFFLGSAILKDTILPAQGQPAAILGKTGDNAATGILGSWDFGSSDIAFKASKGQIWVVDAFDEPVPFINIFDANDLSGAPRRIPIILPADFAEAPVLGLAEVAVGEFKGKNLVLIDPTFGTQSAPQPLLGVYDDDGRQVAGTDFVPPQDVDASARLTSIDASPTEELFAAYDNQNHAFYILDFGFARVQGPFRVLSFQSGFVGPWFFGTGNRQGLRGGGMGLAYNGPERLLISSSFVNLFENHLALEYDLKKDGVYSGQTMDLGAAGLNGLNPDLSFLGMDTGKVGPEDALFALNVGDDSVYAFRVTTYPDVPPVDPPTCTTDPDSGLYQVSWTLDPRFSVDSIRIFENGVEVATVPPTSTSFESPRPLLGKAFIEVITEKGGLLSSLHPVCQVENARQPRLMGVQGDAVQITNLGTIVAVAVTRLPQKAEDFRGYVLGLDTNSVEVFDHTLNSTEVIQMNPPAFTQGRNLAALGVALVHLDGQDRLAILDSDGPRDTNEPSVAIYSLEPPNRGQLFMRVDAIDLSQLPATPFLFDWDSDEKNNFVAGGVDPTGDPVLVRIEFDGTNMTATKMVPIPHSLLTPFDDQPVVGVGVSILPSGNLLVAGADTFSKTYTEAILTTPFTDDPNTSVKVVGYAQGLPVPNQFFGLGPDVGPTVIFGMDTAFFPPEEGRDEGIGVTYIPTGNVAEISNPSTRQVLQFQGDLLIHAENACSHPDLVAEQLVEAGMDINPGESSSTSPLGPTFANRVSSTDYFLYLTNQSKTEGATLSLEVKLDGALVPEGTQKVGLRAGRYFRMALSGRTERTIALNVKNDGTAPASLKVVLGAMAIGGAPQIVFRRGDCNADGSIQLTDAIFSLNWLFKGGPEPPCIDACDVDDNGLPNLSDPVIILNYLFKSGTKPAAPGPDACGEDPTNDDTLKPCSYPPASCQ